MFSADVKARDSHLYVYIRLVRKDLSCTYVGENECVLCRCAFSPHYMCQCGTLVSVNSCICVCCVCMYMVCPCMCSSMYSCLICIVHACVHAHECMCQHLYMFVNFVYVCLHVSDSMVPMYCVKGWRCGCLCISLQWTLYKHIRTVQCAYYVCNLLATFKCLTLTASRATNTERVMLTINRAATVTPSTADVITREPSRTESAVDQ